MFRRQLINLGRQSTMRLASRQASTAHHHHAPVEVGPISAFFRDCPMPVEAYPLAGIVAIMCSYASFVAYKHVVEDKDHVRWTSRQNGALSYEERDRP